VEIENVLRIHPRIYHVGIIGVPDVRLGEIAVTVIDLKPVEMRIEEEVGRFCGQHLPRCKRPRRIIFDKVPRNPAGKTEKPIPTPPKN
jgi:acyl-CoA synthetase (AMP-forming)/AMP-acid ligase II